MLVKITAPTGETVSVERAKERLRIDGTADDNDLARSIEIATEVLEKQTGLTLRQTEYELRLDCWPHWRFPYGLIDLPAAPVREMSEVAYLDEDLVEQTIDPASYYWEPTEEGAALRFVDGYSQPVLGERPGALRVRFTAGFDAPDVSGSGDDPAFAFPPTAEMAILFLVGHWHSLRESVQVEQAFPVPDTFALLASQIRIYR